MEIGKKLKIARVQSGMTQENVAEKIQCIKADNFQTGKMKKFLPRHYQCNRVEQPIFYKS